MTGPPVCLSAPGKVLLAGGYLVLDREYTGLVFGLDARIHVHIKPLPTSSGVTFSEITVKSPQFRDAVWEYGYRLSSSGGGMQVTQLRADADLKLNQNPFIETALSYTLSYISTVATPVIPPSSITILADNDYYSTSSSDVSPGQRFHNFDVPLSQANKTGLGSSAALVTAFTAVLLVFYLPEDIFDIKSDIGRRRVHNLAQASHCAAQGKVGSGFDVASAVYGSCLYKRFSPTILEGNGDPGSKGFSKTLRKIVEETDDGDLWDTEIKKDAVKVPEGLRLVMCDVSGGSQTPGMVRKLLAWRSQNQAEATHVWKELQKSNEALSSELVRLTESGSKDYRPLTECISSIRGWIRQMSEKSGVPIEPRAQTRLLDACSKLDGVLGGVVPGAGGYDAVALLIEDRKDVVEALETLLKDWTFEEAKGGKVSMLGVREEMEGVREEPLGSYAQWVE